MALLKKLFIPAVTAVLFAALCCACMAYSARSMILIEAESGAVLDSVDCDKRLPMASTTKIMTALVVLERVPLTETVAVTPASTGVEGSSMYLAPGERLTVEQLLYGLMLSSGNDAASALAIHVAGGEREFAALMNERARSLGLSDTHFVNPSGLPDDDHYTTARELAVITAAALQNPDFRRIVSMKSVTLAGRTLTNHNKLLKLYDGAIGVKTGFTKKAGRCLVSAAERDGVTLICVTLNDGDDWNDHIAALELGFSKVKRVTLAEAGGVSITLKTPDGESVIATNPDGASAVLKKDAEVTSVIRAPRFIYAPAASGDRVGRVDYYSDGALVASCPLALREGIAAPPLKKELLISRMIQRIKEFINDRICKTAKVSRR